MHKRKTYDKTFIARVALEAIRGDKPIQDFSMGIEKYLTNEKTARKIIGTSSVCDAS